MGMEFAVIFSRFLECYCAPWDQIENLKKQWFSLFFIDFTYLGTYCITSIFLCQECLVLLSNNSVNILMAKKSTGGAQTSAKQG